MHKKAQEQGDIWSSIQQLKRRLRTDRQQLQDMKKDMSRGRSSSNLRQKTLIEHDKENRPALANRQQSQNELRRNIQKEDLRLIELRKQYKSQMQSQEQRHARELSVLQKANEQKISKLTTHFQSLLLQKDKHIQLLQQSLQKDVNASCDCVRQQEAIKEYYENEIRKMKQSYQTIINNLSEENNELTLRQNTHNSKDVTFKNMLLSEQCNRLTIRIAQSHQNSVESVEEARQELKENNLYKNFKDKFKFNKRSIQNSSVQNSSRSSLMVDHNLPTTKRQSFLQVQRKNRQLKKECTLEEAWTSWIGSEKMGSSEGTKDDWEDREIKEEDSLMNTIRNIKASLLN